MKLIHLSDLHIGKRVNEYSMIEDQKYILNEIIKIIDDEKPEAVLICGDVYDKTVPSAEAVLLFDSFLVELSNRNLKAFVISGNHDSPERIAFASRIMSSKGIYMSPVYNKDIEPLKLRDNHGEVNVYMLPFIKPVHVRQYFPEENIENYTDAVKVALNHLKIDKTNRNILLTHQFVAGSESSDSEEMSVGGSDNVEVEAFDGFDYVALGHIHKPQKIGRDTIRYCGTPLKYSFSEANHKKSVTVVHIEEKGNVTITTRDLNPLRDMVEIKGKYMDLVAKSYYSNLNTDAYYRITLTDEDDVPDAMNKLRVIYKNIMRLDYDNKRTSSKSIIEGSDKIEKKSPLDLISEFYMLQNNQELSKEQEVFLKDLIEEIWGEQR